MCRNILRKAYKTKLKECDKTEVISRDPKYHYCSESKPRGFCLIFNMNKFGKKASTRVIKREGSLYDVDKLAVLFKILNFIPKVNLDLTKCEFEETIEEYSKKNDLKRHDCIIVIVMSHGRSTGFQASDLKEIRPEDVIEGFNQKNCPLLENKPKIFIFVFCRGETHNFGFDIDKHYSNNLMPNVEETSGFLADQKITNLSCFSKDTAVLYSTQNGFVSTRKKNGTYLVDGLVDAILEHAHEFDLKNIFVKVNGKVRDKQKKHGRFQITEAHYHQWKKSFYFNYGYNPSLSEAASPMRKKQKKN